MKRHVYFENSSRNANYCNGSDDYRTKVDIHAYAHIYTKRQDRDSDHIGIFYHLISSVARPSLTVR